VSTNESPAAEVQRTVVLIVEDDPTFRRLLARSLETQGFHTREAENGMVAKTIFDLNIDDIKLVISDIKMPQLDGVGLLAYVRSKSKVPVILMTGFADIIEMKSAFELGATDFVNKPFSTQVMLETIKRCLAPQSAIIESPAPPPEPEEEKHKYCPVHIDEFISSSNLRSDIYIRLSEKKYVRVAHAGEAISVDRLRTYKEKKVDYLYVTIDDFNHYVDFSLKLTLAASSKSGVPKEKRLRLLKHTTEIIVEKCFLGELDPEIVAPARRMVEDTLSIVMSDPANFNIFSNLQTYSDRIYAHSVAVSIYSCMVAQQHGWTSAGTQFRVSIAGLLHDIGKKEIPKTLIAKTRLERTPEDTEQLETHCLRGRDIILQLKGLPEDISQIVYQHHETAGGTGYPKGANVGTIHPLAKLVSTVDRFAELVLPLSENVSPLGPQAALEKISQYQADSVDATFLRRIMTIFKFKEREP
jgi:response regulator RpfG family c-di-GMP phosphodiesterase